MPIIIDSSELRSNSTMPEIPNSVESSILEEITGADFMISQLSIPTTTPTLIEKHIESGALMVQRKHGLDLSSSVGERLNSSLAKMVATGAKQSQCILLFVGFLTEDDEGFAVINKQRAHMPFLSVQGAISKWHDRGGVYENLSRPKSLPEWCRMKLRHLNEYKQLPIKRVLQKPAKIEEFNSLQIPVLVEDGRNLLIVLPGIGLKTANILFKEFDGNVSEILCWLSDTDMKTKQKIKGIGPKTVENFRKFIGIDDVMGLELRVLPEILENKSG